MIFRSPFLAIFVFLNLTACSTRYIAVHKIPINRSSLASTFTKTPDPLQADPPTGQKIFVQWWLPIETNPEDVDFTLYVIYKNLDEESFPFKVQRRVGAKSFSFTGKEFKRRKGLFSYKVEAIDKNGKVLDVWKQRMWVNIIRGSDEMQAVTEEQQKETFEKDEPVERPESPALPETPSRIKTDQRV